jgi:hypothetical protein
LSFDGHNKNYTRLERQRHCEGGARPPEASRGAVATQSPTRLGDCFVAKSKSAPRNDVI